MYFQRTGSGSFWKRFRINGVPLNCSELFFSIHLHKFAFGNVLLLNRRHKHNRVSHLICFLSLRLFNACPVHSWNSTGVTTCEVSRKICLFLQISDAVETVLHVDVTAPLPLLNHFSQVDK